MRKEILKNIKYAETYGRQAGIVNSGVTDLSVMIVGCGGIGSPTAMALTKMGVKEIILVDHDTVENHNLPNQIFKEESIAQDKPSALGGILSDFRSDLQVQTFPGKFGKKVWGIYHNRKRKVDVVIAAVDDINARKFIWRTVKKTPGILYIDGRMAREDMQIYAAFSGDPKSEKDYEATLFPKSRAEAIACTERAVIYNVFVIAGMISMLVKRFVNSEDVPNETLFSLKSLRLLSGKGIGYRRKNVSGQIRKRSKKRV